MKMKMNMNIKRSVRVIWSTISPFLLGFAVGFVLIVAAMTLCRQIGQCFDSLSAPLSNRTKGC